MLSPLKTLERGYAIVRTESQLVTSSARRRARRRASTCALARGRFGARVEDVRAVSETEQTFEQAQAELEQIVERLEQGQASLDEALALWERGEQLYAFCRERLDAAQGKVEELARRVEQARPEPQA